MLATAPLPGLRRPLLVAVGSELEPVMAELEPSFERAHPGVDLRWQVLGSEDMLQRSLDPPAQRPRVLIPANRRHLEELAETLRVRGEGAGFVEDPRPIARTLLVAVVWPERAASLFPQGRFSIDRLRRAAAAGQWEKVGGTAEWGSFDLRATDPLRSNSGQLTLALWCRGQPPPACTAALRRALYRPARSTDILLREFISGGPNEGDVAMVYEASALARSRQAEQKRPGGYSLLVPDPTYETVLAAAIRRGRCEGSEADGRRFVGFLLGEPGQGLLRRGGFRNPQGRGGSPQGDRVKRMETPSRAELEELLRLWQGAA